MTRQHILPHRLIQNLTQAIYTKSYSFEFKFLKNLGIYSYKCLLHPGMIGKINVLDENGYL